ncbi:MAG: mandelate racemase/muconate lactonizing enzyme family protein [Chloroflexi bacterium]|nr:mandelate racemase/muconate lactonizing enzyme family protein [Chloroflexota bacterium]
MQVTDVKTFLVHPGRGKNWLIVKVETDAGIHGWGEAYTQADRDRAIEVHIHQMKRYLIGRDPFAIKHFTTVMYLDWAGKRGAMDSYCAVSGIEQALWDIVGKASGQPVYNLLGGRCRDRIRVYANGWGGGARTPEALGEAAKQLVDRGFTAMKFDPFPNPWREFISRDQERQAVATVRAVRQAVGPEIDLLIEVHRRLAPQHAVRVARMIEEYEPFWYEEPVSSRNMDLLAQVKREITTPVVTGEELYTKAEFRKAFELGAADIINPDICNCGGILELKEIAAMAETYSVVVSPHNYNSTTMGLAATVQLCACIPNFLITEYFVNFEEIGREIAPNALVAKDGYITLPTSPGLGVEMDEAAMVRRGYQEFPLRTIRQPGDEP